MSGLASAIAKVSAASLALWPTYAQPAFAFTNTHPVAKGLPAMRGSLAVAVYLSVTNGLPWATAYAYGQRAYAIALLAHVSAGGALPTAKHFAGATSIAAIVSALGKTGFANTVAIANGMLGTVANSTKSGTSLGFAPLASTASPVTYAIGAACVALAYNGVPAFQPAKPANTKLAKVTLPTL